MSSWTARAKAATTQTGQSGTAETDETPLLGVLAVSAVTPPAVVEKTTDWHALDAAYLAHHFNCPACIAAGREPVRFALRHWGGVVAGVFAGIGRQQQTQSINQSTHRYRSQFAPEAAGVASRVKHN